MFQTTQDHLRGLQWAGLTLFLLLCWGCAGSLRLYDENKAKLTAGVKEEYANADVLGVIDVEKRNLDNLLAEELKVIRDNHRLQVDFALLRIADDNAPMSGTYTTKALKRLNRLGYPGGLKQLRGSLQDDVDISEGHTALQENAQLIENLTNLTPPACENESLPETMQFPESLAPDKRNGAESYYRDYRNECAKLQKLGKHSPSGDTKQALKDWQIAQHEMVKLNQSVSDAEKDAKKKSDMHDQVKKELENARASGSKVQKALADKAASLLKDLKLAEDIAKFLDSEDAAKKRLNSLVVLLTAAAGGKIDTSDPKLKTAATIAKEIPSLAGDITDLLKQARAPSVNNLLIEMRHQVLLLEYAKQLRILAQQRVDILNTRYDALQKEARFWLNFGDAVCSYAIVSGGGDFPRRLCDDFSVSFDTQKKMWTCTVPTIAAIKNCALGKAWHEAIRSPGNGLATRELYKALGAYLQALAIQATQHEQTFRLIDVQHRESLASRESAIRGWDNLVAVPVNQLAAYYQAGLKPAEIADLIVKALGFTAIAVGVSQ